MASGRLHDQLLLVVMCEVAGGPWPSTPDRREDLADQYGTGPGDRSEATMVAAYEAVVASRRKG